MPGTPPEGTPVPTDGRLPAPSLDQLDTVSFGLYVHVPFCASRCGYCDFNTYTASELGGGASRESYAGLAVAEIALARKVLGPAAPAVSTVFFGGGTPTLLPPADLAAILRAIGAEFGVADGAEVTTEANPESVDQQALAELREAGFTRISLGMQSAATHVLGVLDRVHSPGRAEQCVAWARSAGFEHVSLDLIYGTPGETAQDWELSLRSALDAGPDHISAYALIVEEGTRLAARIRSGELPAPDDDEMADRYLAADEMLSAARMRWYEVSNWATGPDAACRHNLLYWTNGEYLGLGPSAQSYLDGTRFGNVADLATYDTSLAENRLPIADRIRLSEEEQLRDAVIFGLRLIQGIPTHRLHQHAANYGHAAITARLLAQQLIEEDGERSRLSAPGRLQADTIAGQLY